MKKRIFTIVAALTLASLSLVGCGSDDTKETTTVAGNNSSVSHEAKGYIFEADGVKVGMDMEAAPIIKALGEPKNYFEAASCAFEGLDKMYGYGSYEVDTYELEGKDYISGVIFKDDMVSTPEGVSIGKTKDDMIKAYGDGFKEEQGMLVYEKEGTKIKFVVDANNEITSITYSSTILDK